MTIRPNSPSRRFWHTRLRYSDTLYYTWYVLAVAAACAAIFTGPLMSEWGWALGWTVGAVALSAHARLERFDGHTHRDGVEVP